MGSYSYTGQTQVITVSTTGIYDITAYGAQGGTGGGSNSHHSGKYYAGGLGGLGAETGGYFILTQGEELKIIVGGKGGDAVPPGPYAHHGGAGGGGGGTWVLGSTDGGATWGLLLVSAGGGGGGAATPFKAGYSGAGGASAALGKGSGYGDYDSNFQTGGGEGGAGFKGPGYYSGIGPTYTNGGAQLFRYSGGGGFGGGGAGGNRTDTNIVAGGGGGGGFSGGLGGFGGSYYGYSGHGGQGGGYGYGGAGRGAEHPATSYINASALEVVETGGTHSGAGFLSIDPTPCYCSGSMILTDRGEVAVEKLAIGDLLVTASGGRRPIKWIGHREVDCAAHPDPEKVWPVRIAASAVALGVPRRDLYVSPDHCIFFDDVLVVARLLLNGSTIVQERIAEVTYWHIELDSHDMILAEGLPAESYLDCGNRRNFANGGTVMSLHPDFAMTDLGAEDVGSGAKFLGAKYLAPRIWAQRSYARHIPEGPRLAAVRAWLGSRAEYLGAEVTSDPELRLYADGESLAPVFVEDNCYRFDLRGSTRSLRLRSNAGVPRHMHRLNNDDDRRLGVSVRRIEIDGRSIALDDPRLTDGWQAVEGQASAAWRWTTGDAAIPVGATVALWIDALSSYPLPWRRPDPAIRDYGSASRYAGQVRAARP